MRQEKTADGQQTIYNDSWNSQNDIKGLSPMLLSIQFYELQLFVMGAENLIYQWGSSTNSINPM
ncbi:hypothetical protein V1477_012242 [Vespula maculifrons]|uniref:Uncharacterized protein n=1 Tax=Vespula maculifrons TaxID=7453 RepID=A0ABD2BWX4_VESMC